MAGAGILARAWAHPAVKPVVFAASLAPALGLTVGAVTGTLGPNPAEALVRGTGDWALRMLWVTLALTPLRRVTGWNGLARLRRMAGLFAAFYAGLHLAAYAWLDMGLDLPAMLQDLPKRPFVLVGALALMLMLPLVATSSDRAIRWLGAARWRALHRSTYVIAVLVLLHFLWMRSAKNDLDEVVVHALLLALLFAERLWHAARPRLRR